ncbi:hypothetical protein HPB48_007243 [Haemaphysalis longicornis]|uniref:Uncharacterized protein n=1 Tax=Haemaphysalis longicornis TaxID=44386 RepID=A0A9J6H269_HAELO|nr:hypothetical protein HPB48_007243 [Haemaphysalis longicornis]
MEMQRQLVPGADGDAATVEAHASDDEEDNCMHQDDDSLVESQNLSEKGKTGSVKSWSEIGEKLIGVTDIKIKDEKHSFEIYGLAPVHSVKCVIQAVPEGSIIQEIIENIEQDSFELYAARRMEERSTTEILTFAGSEVPRCVYLYRTAHRCTLHKKTVPVCRVCYEVGHRNTACPRPGTRACHECGMRDPGPDPTSVAKCPLCEGAHVTGAKGCSRRFVTPYVIRRREQQQRRQAQGQHQVKSQEGLQHKASAEQQRRSKRDRSSSQSRRDRSATPERRGRSTSNTS